LTEYNAGFSCHQDICQISQIISTLESIKSVTSDDDHLRTTFLEKSNLKIGDKYHCPENYAWLKSNVGYRLYKACKLSQKGKLNENRGKFINFSEIGRTFINSVEIGGMRNMHHWLREMEVPVQTPNSTDIN